MEKRTTLPRGGAVIIIMTFIIMTVIIITCMIKQLSEVMDSSRSSKILGFSNKIRPIKNLTINPSS